MEVRHDVVGLVQGTIDAGVGEHDAGDAASVNRKMKPIAQYIGVRICSEPPHIVAIQENTLTPVGTAMTIVAKTK